MKIERFEDFFTHDEPAIVQAAQLLAEARTAFESGQMTQSEFTEIVDNIFRIDEVDEIADNLDRKVRFQQAITTLKFMASKLSLVDH